MKEIVTEIEIDASAEAVWEILVDFGAYPDWNPLIRSAVGEVLELKRIKIKVELTPNRRMTFRPTLLKVTPGQELRWLGRLMLPGLFDGAHAFLLNQVSATRTKLIQKERFTGMLVPIIWRFIAADTERTFHAMNKALKIRTERPKTNLR